MTPAELLGFMRTQRLAVQASCAPDGGAQAALVGIAVTDAFEIVFDTLETTRKARNLRTSPRAAFVLGGRLVADERTIQFEGIADEPAGVELESIKRTYFAAWPDGQTRAVWPGITYFRVRPSWIRFSDFNCAPPKIIEFTAEQLATVNNQKGKALEPVSHDGRRWSNADEDRVGLIDYNPEWPYLFEAEASRIRIALAGRHDFSIEHFGSTAIQGLAAKPIIDIMLIVAEQSNWPSLIEPLERLSYVFWSENPRRDRMFFVKGMPPFGAGRTHHIHVRTPTDAKAPILFRDYLRSHPDAASRYATLKRELAERYSTDRDAYTEGKTRFVDEIIRKALSSLGAV